MGKPDSRPTAFAKKAWEGKSGLRKDAVADNVGRERSQGKCHSDDTTEFHPKGGTVMLKL